MRRGKVGDLSTIGPHPGFDSRSRYAAILIHGLEPTLTTTRCTAPRRNNALRGVVNAVLPPQCLACDTLVATPGSLCLECRVDAKFITAPQCTICDVPYSFDPNGNAVYGACVREHPRYERALAVLHYDDRSRRLVMVFKHGDCTYGAPTFGH